MKLIVAPMIAALAMCFAAPAAGQDRVAGTWRVESVGGVQPPEGAELSLTFANAGRLTLTYTLAGRAQSWDYTYRVAEGQLVLEPARAFGEPSPVTYDLRFSAGKLELLTPEPETGGDEPGETDGEETDAAGTEAAPEPGTADGAAEAASGDTDADDADNSADAQREVADDGEAEQDTREAVWVLVPDNDA